MTAIQNKTNNVNKHFLVKKEIILCCFFGGGEGWWFMSLSRIFHLYPADHSSKVGENGRTRGKTIILAVVEMTAI